MKALRSNPYQDPDVFFMSLEEAKSMISERSEFEGLAEKHERQKLKRMRTQQG